jgi:hypothetical protein
MNRRVAKIAGWTLGAAFFGGLLSQAIPNQTAFGAVLQDAALVVLGAFAGLGLGAFLTSRSN